ncbi:MAG: hypothetical protein Q8L34_03595 [Candidatus Woesearchaeota archaeon]|nr:hypothetical protein [Candidatus Woesearchaeota archaeon]
MDSLEGVVRQLYPAASVFFEQEVIPQVQKIRQLLTQDASKAEVSAEITHLKALYIRLATKHCQDRGAANVAYVSRIVAKFIQGNPVISCNGYERVVQVAYAEVDMGKTAALQLVDIEERLLQAATLEIFFATQV